jgi:class 3 adenylate cyclase
VLSETRYAPHGDLGVAYRTTGAGSRDIIFVSNWFTNCEIFPELPVVQGWVERMSRVGRLIFFDQPGTGASDPVTFDSLPTLERWVDSITAVLNDLESAEAVLVTVDGSFATGALFAATYPSRTSALVVLEGWARLDDDPEARDGALIAMWGTGEMQHLLNPDMPWDEDIRARWARQERLAASPKTVRTMVPLVTQLDIRDVLPSIRVPTLILQHAHDAIITPEHGRYLADHIRDAKYVELPGRNLYFFVEPDSRRCVEEIGEFLTGTRGSVEEDRVLATVVFTDIVSSTEQLAARGDDAWRRVLDSHDRAMNRVVEGHRGRVVKQLGDGILATFDGPARAVRCAAALLEAARDQGMALRAGVHTGEIEIRPADVTGIAVHIASRIAALADANEILVSRTVVDLTTGSGLQFERRGEPKLKGVPGTWPIFAVRSTT